MNPAIIEVRNMEAAPHPITGRTVDAFIAALERLEAAQDVEPMVSLYGPDSSVGNVVVGEKFQGPDGARHFWSVYRGTFRDIRSTFRNRFVTAGGAALEWTSEGTTAEGAPFRYDGVSILEIDGERIAHFRAYFDAQRLGRQIEADGVNPSAAQR